MINLLLSFLSFTTLFLIFKIPFDFSIWASTFPSIVAFMATYILLARKIFKRFEAVIYTAQAELQRQATLKNPVLRTLEGAINILKSAYPLGRWQFFIKGQIDAQIGVIYYTNDKVKEAFPYLKNSFLRHWVARGMLASYYYRQKQYDEMKTAFTEAIKGNKKVPMLYNVYAWCLSNMKDNEKAKEVLSQGLKVLPDNQNLQKSLIALQNDKEIKLKVYGDEWYQFRLEKHPNELLAQKPMLKQGKKQHIQRR